MRVSPSKIQLPSLEVVLAASVAILAALCCFGLPLLIGSVAGGAVVAGRLAAPLPLALVLGIAAGAGAAVVLVRRRAQCRAVEVELLYFDGCPNYQDYLPHLRQLVSGAGEVRLRPIETEEAALMARFIGSPTVRVDGRDVETEAAGRTEYGLQCRLYRTASGWLGTPPDEWVLAALRNTRRQAA